MQKGRAINSTPAGRALIHVLPDMATLPDMTAHWESILTQISEKQFKYQDFMMPLNNTLIELITQAKRRPNIQALEIFLHRRITKSARQQRKEVIKQAPKIKRRVKTQRLRVKHK